MEIKLIKTEQDYKEALNRIDELFDAKPGTHAGDELDLWITLVEKYENECEPFPDPDPIEAIRFMMEQQGIDHKDLGEIINSRSRASEILNKRRKLTINQIRKIRDKLHISADILIKDYKLS